jgi:hypothetical protein
VWNPHASCVEAAILREFKIAGAKATKEKKRSISTLNARSVANMLYPCFQDTGVMYQGKRKHNATGDWAVIRDQKVEGSSEEVR